MKYYKVKPEHDNKRRWKFHKGGGLEIDGVMLGNELYTPKEVNKYLGLAACCEVVEIPKSKIYFSFGARYSTVTGGYKHEIL